jgi:CpeS-like protein
MNTKQFQDFFDCCVGRWSTERTYHYLTHQDVERSHTDFQIEALTLERKIKVLEDNQYAIPENIESLPGYYLAFATVSEKGDRVSQQLNLLFVPTQQDGQFLTGDYLRDRAYEEAKPIVSAFRFNLETNELQMTTYYTRVVSIDSIILVNPRLRIRKILNYERPPEGRSLEKVVLVGFGVEQKK